MLSFLIYGCKQGEMELLQDVVRDAAAFFSDEHLTLKVMDAWKPEELKQIDHFEVAIVDVTLEGGLQAAIGIRAMYPLADIVIVSDPTISPVVYLIPEIRPATLLLKPFVSMEIRERIRSLFAAMPQKDRTSDEMFVFQEEGESRRVPYAKILFFEARNKRIYIRVQSREYGLQGTMEALETVLPDFFRRCHRGFIVNVNYVSKVWYSRNAIHLTNGEEIPLSRSYKTVMKEALKNGIDDQ